MTGIGTSSSNITGLNNAAYSANLLVNPTTGVPNGMTALAGIVLPQQVVNTLADALVACVNSAGAGSQGCTTLFNATSVNSVQPIDTLQAALNIALHPASNVNAIFGLVSSSAPFQPAISGTTPPATGPWRSALTEAHRQSRHQQPAAGCAVDNAANVYLSDYGTTNGVVEYNSSGTLVRSYTVSNPTYPQEVILDGLGNVFAATYIPQGSAAYNSKVANPASLVEFSGTGSLLSPALGYMPTTGQISANYSTGYVGLTSQFVAPGGMAIDGSGNLWLAGNDGQSIPAFGNMNISNLPAYVTEIVGIAAPVVTPLSVALKSGKLATRP